MTKEISIPYTQSTTGTSSAILVSYTIEKEDSAVTLNCAVTSSYPQVTSWLNLRKFKMRAKLEGKSYTALFDDELSSTTIDVTLFIDQAYKSIMQKERLPLTA